MSIVVLHDRPQADGSRWTTYTISLAVGHSVDIGPTKVPVGVSAEDHGVTMEARWTPRLIAQELNDLDAQVLAGKVDPLTYTPKLNTRRQLHRKLLRRMFNRMRDADTGDTKHTTLLKSLPVLNLFTDAQAADIITGWSEAEVTGVRAKLTDLAAVMNSLDHGKERA